MINTRNGNVNHANLTGEKKIDDCTLKSDGSRGQMFYFVKNNKINSVM